MPERKVESRPAEALHPLVRRAMIGAAAYILIDIIWLTFQIGGAAATQAFSDISGCVTAMAATAACTYASRRGRDFERRAWGLLALAGASWAMGEIIWTYYELVARVEVPFPSLADIGFLAAYPLAAIAMISFPTTSTDMRSRARTVLDGLIVGASLMFIGWATLLGPLYRAGGGPWTEQAIGLAYPVSDIVVASIVLLVMTRVSGRGRPSLSLLAGGLIALAVADSVFSFLTLQEVYSSGGAIDAAWDVGYLLIALAAVRHSPVRVRPERSDVSRFGLILPYASVTLVLAAAGWRRASYGSLGPLLFWGLLLVIFLVAVRLLVTLMENFALTRNLEAKVAERTAELERSEEALRQQALHDPLTGLANRALFADRAEHALASSTRRAGQVAVIFCDLDGFKEVNDTFGHAVGDQLLCAVAERLLEIVRDEDTVARFGGDEFAVLLDQVTDEESALAVARRTVETLRTPFWIEGRKITAGTSAGIALTRGRTATVEDLLRMSDAAMYAAKSRGRNRLEVFEPEMIDHREPTVVGETEGTEPAVG